jgi:hypothetical protein
VTRQLKPPSPERAAAEEIVRGALLAGRFLDASLAVAEFEAKQPTPRGIGVDWIRHDPARDVGALTAIFARVPGILKGITDDALESVRFAAAMQFLWGGARRRWLDRTLGTGTRFNADTAARMFVFFGMHLRARTKTSFLRPYFSGFMK